MTSSLGRPQELKFLGPRNVVKQANISEKDHVAVSRNMTVFVKRPSDLGLTLLPEKWWMGALDSML